MARRNLSDNPIMLFFILTSIRMGNDYSRELLAAARQAFPDLRERTFRRILNQYDGVWIQPKTLQYKGRIVYERSALGRQYTLTERSEKLLHAGNRLRQKWRLHNLRLEYTAVGNKLEEFFFKRKSWVTGKHGNFITEMSGAKIIAYPQKNKIEIMPKIDFFGNDAVALGGVGFRYCDNVALQLRDMLNSMFNLKLRFRHSATTSGEVAQPDPNLDVWTYGLNVKWLKGWVDHSTGTAELEYKLVDLDRTIDVNEMPQRIKSLYDHYKYVAEWNPPPHLRN